MRLALEYLAYGTLALLLLAAAMVVVSNMDLLLVNAFDVLRTTLVSR